MKKLVLRWIGLLIFVAVLAVVFVNLGEWQLSRLDSRKASNAHVLENQAREVQPYQQVMNHPIEAADEWLRVSLRGRFDPDNQVLIRYRSYAGQTGSELVTPFQTEQGEWVVVDRGFIVRQPGGLEPEVLPTPPAGVVDLVGYIRKTEQGKPQATDPVEGRARLINPKALSAALGKDFLDGYVSLIEVEPAQGSGVAAMAPPALDEGPHFWYAVQWFCFTVIALGGFVVLVRADLRDRKKRLARQAAVAQRVTATEAP